MKLRLYADGGSRGNPGPSAAGFVLFELEGDAEGEVVHEEGVYLGTTTNNQAEYEAIRLGLEKARDLGATDIDVRLDSQLAVRQLNGQYKVKNAGIRERFNEIQLILPAFDRIVFSHIRREQNAHADRMVNEALDAVLR
ncbi:MAG: ribonuclease HI family protein [bacterium]|nr:ribonuclease HI family protein [bacterium]